MRVICRSGKGQDGGIRGPDLRSRREGDPVRIGIVGSSTWCWTPYFNLQVEEQLGDLGAYVERSVYSPTGCAPPARTRSWGIPPGVRGGARRSLPFPTAWGGGHPQHRAQRALQAGGFRRGGAPASFTCMPETIAKGILPLVSRDQGIPVISLVIDEQTARRSGNAPRGLHRPGRLPGATPRATICHRERSVAIFFAND